MSPTEQFGFSTTTDDVLQGVDLTGKAMIVTGGASGIGLETSRSSKVSLRRATFFSVVMSFSVRGWMCFATPS